MKKADATIHLETRSEIFRTAKRCAPCLDFLGPISFLGDPASEDQRRHWIESVWRPILSTGLQQAYLLCRQGHRELMRLDGDIDTRLAGPLAKTSRAAGRELAAHIHAPQGEKSLSRFLEEVRLGNTPGHFAVVFGSRAAAFHIPMPTCLAAFVLLEMSAARLPDLWPAIEDCLTVPAGPAENILAA